MGWCELCGVGSAARLFRERDIGPSSRAATATRWGLDEVGVTRENTHLGMIGAREYPPCWRLKASDWACHVT